MKERCMKVKQDQRVRLVKTGTSPGEQKLMWSDRGDTKVHHRCWQRRSFKVVHVPGICIENALLRREHSQATQTSNVSITSQKPACCEERRFVLAAFDSENSTWNVKLPSPPRTRQNSGNYSPMKHWSSRTPPGHSHNMIVRTKHL